MRGKHQFHVISPLLFQWRLDPSENLRSAQCIIALSFGRTERSGVKPPNSEFALAAIVHSLQTKYKIPIIAQREIAEILESVYGIKADKIVVEPQEGLFTSERVIEQGRSFLHQEKCALSTIIVAHHSHISRCRWIALRKGFEIFIPHIREIPYAKGSSQIRTRTKYFYFFWEIAARLRLIILFILGKI